MELNYAQNSSQIKHNLSRMNPNQILKNTPAMVNFNMFL
jgi:hypothetical protein